MCRIVRQLLTGRMLLAFLSGIAGLVVCYAGTRMLLALAFGDAQRLLLIQARRCRFLHSHADCFTNLPTFHDNGF